MKKLYTTLIIFFIGQNIFAQQQNVYFKKNSLAIKNIIDNVMISSTAYENLRYLCKKIGPRLSGSDNAKKAILATKKMLENAGADTVYLQPCKVTHWVRTSKEEGFYIVNGKQFPLHLTSLGNSEGTKNKMISASIIEVKSMDDLHKFGNALKNKIVFINIPMNPTYIKTGKAYGEAGVGRRTGAAQAAKYGAMAVMVKSLASNADDYPHTGATQYNDSFPKIPAIAISTNDANAISKIIANGLNVDVAFKNDCTILPEANSYNVIGEILGSEFPNEVITVGGHLDSWDLAEGAQDDGAGVVQSIEVIRVLKALNIKPKRTIRAVMFMNEENGSGGAKAYFESAKKSKELHIFALESDDGGFSPRGFMLDMEDSKKLKIKSWASLFLNYGLYDFSETASGADVDDLKQIGTAVAGLETDRQRYFDVHHAAIDVFENVSKREVDLGAGNMAALVWLVSEYGF